MAINIRGFLIIVNVTKKNGTALVKIHLLDKIMTEIYGYCRPYTITQKVSNSDVERYIINTLTKETGADKNHIIEKIDLFSA